MRRKITTIIAGVLAVSMVLGGCGKTQKEEKDNSSDKKTEEKKRYSNFESLGGNG